VETEPKKRRVFFYVDGFNLYHRKLEENPHLKWLCFRTLAEKQLFKTDTVEKVKFFSAEVDTEAEKSPKKRRQATYWKALGTTRVEIVKGSLEPRPRTCKAPICNKREEYTAMVEKMSDVNLALHVYRDFIENKPDIICVLSADMDILPALRMVRETGIPVKIIVLLPTASHSMKFSRVKDYAQVGRLWMMNDRWLEGSRLPENLTLPDGEEITCPDTWLRKVAPEPAG
jgi:hypothetical protein